MDNQPQVYIKEIVNVLDIEKEATLVFLHPLTVLIGNNGIGLGRIVKLLDTLGKIKENEQIEYDIIKKMYYNGGEFLLVLNSKKQRSIYFQLKSNDVDLELKLSRQGAQSLYRPQETIHHYQQKLADPHHKTIAAEEQAELPHFVFSRSPQEQHQSNTQEIVKRLSYLKRYAIEKYERLVSDLRGILPKLSEFILDEEQQSLQWRIQQQGDVYDWRALPFGCYQFLHLASLLLLPVVDDGGEVVVLEEPENSLAPTAIKLLSQILKEVMREKQIIITTHNSVLAHECRPHVVPVEEGGMFPVFLQGSSPKEQGEWLKHFGQTDTEPELNFELKSCDYRAGKTVTFEQLFGYYVKGAKKIQVIEPYVHHLHQTRALLEFLAVVVRRALPAQNNNVEVLLETRRSEFPDIQHDHLEKIEEECRRVGISFSWKLNDNLHDRRIIVDDSWRIDLSRGLQIYDKYNAKDVLQFQELLPECRRIISDFTVTYHPLQAPTAALV